jgi:predicted Zn-dependent protease
METSSIERLAGDLDAAAAELRSAYDALDAVGETYVLSTVAGFLAQTLLEQGAIDEASAYCDRSRDLATEADIATQGLWRYVRGRILARQGASAEAEEIIGEGLALLSPTDAIVYQIEAYVGLGEARVSAGRVDEARAAYAAACALAEQKGGVVILSGILRRIEDLDAATSTT